MEFQQSELTLLAALAAHQPSTRGDLARALRLDAQQIDTLVVRLQTAGCIEGDDHLALTAAGYDVLAPYKVDNAIIMAAGISSRFVPISYEQPKGLLVVRGEVLVERQIRQLQEAGIDDITVVVGYMADSFAYLADKFGVDIVINPDYATRNNNSTLMRVRERLGNTYICSSDNYFTENVFEPYVVQPYYAALYADGPTDEYCMHLDESDRIVEVEIGGSDSWYMLGHIFFDRTFSKRFVEVLMADYDKPETAGKLWEDVYIDHIDELVLYARRYDSSVLHEFDSVGELNAFDPDFIETVESPALSGIVEVLECSRSDIVDIAPVSKTLDNRSFRFTVGEKTYLYRYPGTDPFKAISLLS